MILKENSIETNQHLLQLRNRLPTLNHRDEKTNINDLKPKLVIVASDITSQTKVHFPEMAELYWKNPEKINPAKFLRASMSIPLFFKPYKVKNIPNGPDALQLCRDSVKFYGDEIPRTVRFVDGGLLSNFPINVFHNEKIMPRMPTFGVRLSASRGTFNKTNSLFPFLCAMIKTMRHLYDTDFLLKHEDYEKLICRLDTDNKFNWLDFNMCDDQKREIFKIGAEGAMDFLEKFRWEDYKTKREELYNLRI